MAKKYYVVKKGVVPGIYKSWAECKPNIDGFSGAVFQGFQTLEEAEAFLGKAAEGQLDQEDHIAGEPGQAAVIAETADGSAQSVAAAETAGGSAQSVAAAETADGSDWAVAYVDGSYNVATKEYSYGVVLFYRGEELHVSEKGTDASRALMRNVAGEIEGSMWAMRYCLTHQIPGLDIYFDYAGIEKWCTGEWKANKEGTVAYREFYRKARTQVDIRFVKVKGHSGDTYNDLADRLAKQALGIEA